VLIIQPKGFEIWGREHQVCRLKKTFYGLWQTSMASYSNIDFFCCCHRLQQNDVDNNLYYNISCDELYIILSLYVDDMLLTRNGTFKLIELKKS
jgi:hypothetical protein